MLRSLKWIVTAACLVLLACAGGFATDPAVNNNPLGELPITVSPDRDEDFIQSPSVRLPENVMPVAGAWFWREEEFQPDGYEPFIDLVAEHSAFNIVTTSLRLPLKELTDEDVHSQMKKAAAYGRKLGVGVALDLDVRLARAAFQKRYPNEMQEMLRLRETPLKGSGEVTFSTKSDVLIDHYVYCTTPYIPLSGRLVRVYSYVRGPEGVDPATIKDITDTRCHIQHATDKEVAIRISCDGQTEGRKACVISAFSHLAPDVFSPHIIEFQRELIRRYTDVDLVGAMKDEWGFPPIEHSTEDYWYSDAFAALTQNAQAAETLWPIAFSCACPKTEYTKSASLRSTPIWICVFDEMGRSRPITTIPARQCSVRRPL